MFISTSSSQGGEQRVASRSVDDVSWQPARFGPYNLPPGRTWESFRYRAIVTLGDVIVVDEFVTDSEQVLSDELRLAAADGHDVKVTTRDAGA